MFSGIKRKLLAVFILTAVFLTLMVRFSKRKPQATPKMYTVYEPPIDTSTSQAPKVIKPVVNTVKKNRYSAIKPTRTKGRKVRKTHYMTVTTNNGRLEDKMFQYASLLGITRRHGYTPVLVRNEFLRKIFRMPDFLFMRKLENCQKASSSTREVGIYSRTFENLSHTRNWTIAGYLKSYRYFVKFAKDVRKNFAFSNSIQNQANAILKSSNRIRKIKVGVHIGHGDMAQKGAKKTGFSVADKKYLKHSMDYFRSKFKNVLFIVCSDDIQWCRKNIKSRDVIFVHNTTVVDLAVLASCNHSVITSGSFGWWAAWLAGGTTIYYKNYPQPGTRLAKMFNLADYYPPNWVGML